MKFHINQKVWLPTIKKAGIVKGVDVASKTVKVQYFNGQEVRTDNFSMKNVKKYRRPRKKVIVYFAKLRPDAIIPSKRYEDAGYDIYACFDEEEVVIKPGEIKLIPTGIASAFSPKYVMLLRERGSTGTKGMSVRCGVIDSGYRDEWFVPINNTTDKTIVITKNENRTANENETVYPYFKAIAQALLLPVPNVKIVEEPYTKLKERKSKRGIGKLGSSGK